MHTPRGIRIPVFSMKGRCPRPLDDGGLDCFDEISIYKFICAVNRILWTRQYSGSQCTSESLWNKWAGDRSLLSACLACSQRDREQIDSLLCYRLHIHKRCIIIWMQFANKCSVCNYRRLARRNQFRYKSKLSILQEEVIPLFVP